MSSIDPYFYILDRIGFPNSTRKIQLATNFAVYLLCDTEDGRHIFVHTDRAEFNLSSKKDDEDVFRIFINLTKRLANCESNIDIFDFYDDQELHKAHETKINNKTHKVYRIRKNDLRLYMVFHDSDIVLFRLSTKRQDKINSSEKKKIDDRVKAICKFSTTSHAFASRIRKLP